MFILDSIKWNGERESLARCAAKPYMQYCFCNNKNKYTDIFLYIFQIILNKFQINFNIKSYTICINIL